MFGHPISSDDDLSSLQTIAGHADGGGGDIDGAGTDARFSEPFAAAYHPDGDEIYVAGKVAPPSPRPFHPACTDECL